MTIYIELKHILVEPFRPSSSQDVDVLPLSHSCSIREWKEKFARKDRPFVVFGIVDFNRIETFLAIIPPKYINPAITDNSCEGTPRRIKAPDRPPFLIEDIISLTPSHPLILPIVPTNDIDLTIQIHTRMLLSCIVHRLLPFKTILLPRRIEMTTT